MNWKISDLMNETKEPLRKGYWKITTTSFLMMILSAGTSYSALIRTLNELPDLVKNIVNPEYAAAHLNLHSERDAKMIGVVLTLSGGMLLMSLIVKFMMDVFLENPLEIGANKMIVGAVVDSEKPVMLSDIAFGYDSYYLNAVKILFLRRLYQDLWMLLLIVPGFIKRYEYSMIPYLLSEDPYLSYREVFEKSKKMMNGFKKKAFLLDLYFIPWHILGIATFGITEIFYVLPKENIVKAAFYLKVKENEKGGIQ